ncbi:methyltransferase domain-containing protein [Paenibacillus massiliensis]|uniref:methyltransferase domain-containing protein n=1 Tax=Paenibacillus massiliensis TaxID=225917 RepID=UPI000407A7EB|nr:methyltransferase domain-containing protein [Paenibacillus massiliensis]
MSSNAWNPDTYDQQLAFVTQYGKGLVEVLAPQAGELILDLGCGTGDLCHAISETGARVIGIDMSPEMIEKAQHKYPALAFMQGDAASFAVPEPLDAIFSNAALHWVTEAAEVVSCMWQALKPGGRLVLEFGGHGNVQQVVNAIHEVLSADYGIDGNSLHPWYFPTLGAYSSLLEKQGFRVLSAVHYDRPTMLECGEQGLHIWLEAFAGKPYFSTFTESERQEIYSKIAAACRTELLQDGNWYADYKRLRITAVKPS